MNSTLAALRKKYEAFLQSFSELELKQKWVWERLLPYKAEFATASSELWWKFQLPEKSKFHPLLNQILALIFHFDTEKLSQREGKAQDIEIARETLEIAQRWQRIIFDSGESSTTEEI